MLQKNTALAQPDDHVIRLSVVEPYADAPVIAGGEAPGAPIINVLLRAAIPIETRSAGGGIGVDRFVDRGVCSTASLRGDPLRQAGGLNDVAVRILELELNRDGAAAFENADRAGRAANLRMGGIVDRLEKAVEAVDHPVRNTGRRRVAGNVARRAVDGLRTYGIGGDRITALRGDPGSIIRRAGGGCGRPVQ